MHGRVKVRTSAEEAVRKAKERAQKVIIYKGAMSLVFAKRKNEELDAEALNITGQILNNNPDIYTIWNIRKEIVLHLAKAEDVAEVESCNKQKLFETELVLTENCLRVNPKSYGAWHHRCWVMDNAPEPDWEKELALCTKYLKFDERNFHCWDYRRFVVSRFNISSEEELKFSTEKIQQNFSNYSSWHYRSKLLPKLFPDEQEGDRQIQEDKLQEELEMVQNAAFTDPDDSSAWFYQRWLLGRAEQPLEFATAHIFNNYAIVALTKASRCYFEDGDYHIKLFINDSIIPGDWSCQSKHHYDTTWILDLNPDILPDNCTDFKISVQLCDNSDKIISELALKEISKDRFIGYKPAQFDAQFGSAVKTELEAQLESCNQLLEMESDSKWTLLTSALIMRALDNRKYHCKSLETVKKLITVDKLRTGYYMDLASRWVMEEAIAAWLENENELRSGVICLRGLGLTAIYHTQYLCLAREIDVSGNPMTNKLVDQLSALKHCNIIGENSKTHSS